MAPIDESEKLSTSLETYIIRVYRSSQKAHAPVGVVEDVRGSEKTEFKSFMDLKKIFGRCKKKLRDVEPAAKENLKSKN